MASYNPGSFLTKLYLKNKSSDGLHCLLQHFTVGRELGIRKMSCKTVSLVILGFCRGVLGQAMEGEEEGDAEQKAYVGSLFAQPQLLMQPEQVHSGSLIYSG